MGTSQSSHPVTTLRCNIKRMLHCRTSIRGRGTLLRDASVSTSRCAPETLFSPLLHEVFIPGYSTDHAWQPHIFMNSRAFLILLLPTFKTPERRMHRCCAGQNPRMRAAGHAQNARHVAHLVRLQAAPECAPLRLLGSARTSHKQV